MDQPEPGAAKWFGARVKRVEDPALLRGKGRYVDDIHLPDLAHAAFVRSPHAHASVGAVDGSAAQALPGVHAVLTLADIAPLLTAERIPAHQPSGFVREIVDPYVLAKDEVCHVGEAVAVVIADDPYTAEDAAALVDVDYSPLPAVADCRAALAEGAPTARAECGSNLVGHFVMEYGDCDAAFAGAAHVFRETLFQHKGLGHAIECRGVIARHDPIEDLLTVWSGTQMAHRAQNLLVTMLGLTEDQVRVITPDVGGGFGPKFVFYAEEVVIPAAARLLGRPIKWIEDRKEHFVAATQERDQHWDMEVAVDGDGRLLAVRGTMIHDHGAFTPYGVNLPYNSGTNFLGPYVLPHYRLECSLALTNMVPVTPVRGAGRPQGTFAMERLMDRIARELGLDRTEVRRRNLIPAAAMPYTTEVRTRDGAAMTYDSGDYPASQAEALEKAGYGDFRARQDDARKSGRHLGIGVANYVEGTGRGPFESATVRVGSSGQVYIYTGATEQGQGNRTTLAQICAEGAGRRPRRRNRRNRRHRDRAARAGRFCQPSGGDRGVVGACRRVRRAGQGDQSRGASAGGRGGGLDHRGRGGARSGGPRHVGHAGGCGPSGRRHAGFFAARRGRTGVGGQRQLFARNPHLLQRDPCLRGRGRPETGGVEILNYVVVHDSGRLINPMIVDGQVIGGAVHGLGCALFERMIFDGDAQPQTMNFGEYLMPTAPEVPSFSLVHKESPTPLNPLGVKGAGEGGTIPVTSAVASAVEDALSDYGVRISELPILPQRLVELVAASAAGADR